MPDAVVDSIDYRNALARFASGVTVVTTRDGDESPVGFTASAFCSLSLNPPLVLVCLEKRAECYEAFRHADRFAVSILAEDQVDIALRFATKGIDKFAGTPIVHGEATGLPLIAGATVHLECRMYDQPDGGDHTILIGEVVRAVATDRAPMLHFNRHFGSFVPQ
jgi:flavin reductase ActVB